jgi:hypothetical protein
MNLHEVVRLAVAKMLDEQNDLDWQPTDSLKLSPQGQHRVGKPKGRKMDAADKCLRESRPEKIQKDNLRSRKTGTV